MNRELLTCGCGKRWLTSNDQRTSHKDLTMETSTNRSDVIAVETHSSPLWGLIILLAVLGPAVSVALVPSAPARVALAAVAVIGLGAFAMAWGGFKYRFLHHGLEIRTLRDQLRTMPKQDIVSY